MDRLNPLDLSEGLILRHLNLILVLQIHPEDRLDAKVFSEPERGVSCNSAFPVHDLVDTTRGHPDRYGKLVLVATGYLVAVS